ncbi:MAG: hypothetical protein ACYCZ6_04860 [Polaromonas sp.]
MNTAQLLAIVEVPRDVRVRCQAAGCHHPVFRRIHVVREGAAVHVYGSECFKRLFESSPAGSSTPQYTSSDGRHLTQEERQLLIENTERLIQQFEAEYQAELARQAGLAAIRQSPVTPAAPAPPPPPRLPIGAAARQAAEAEARQIVRSRYGVDPELPGWRGLVLAEVRRILGQNAVHTN